MQLTTRIKKIIQNKKDLNFIQRTINVIQKIKISFKEIKEMIQKTSELIQKTRDRLVAIVKKVLSTIKEIIRLPKKIQNALKNTIKNSTSKLMQLLNRPAFNKNFFATEKSKILLAKFKLNHPMSIMLITTGLVFGCIFGYLHFKSQKMKEALLKNSNPIVFVSALPAENQMWQSKFKASGSLRAVQGVDVTTELAGLIRSIEFSPGSFVKAGDLLVQLNIDEEIARLHSFQALAELARITYERNKLQFEVHGISKESLDISEADYKNRLAQIAAEEAIIAKKTIVAPFDGRLGVAFVTLGQYIGPGEKVVTLQTLDPIYFDFYVPQQIVNQIELNHMVEITSDAFPSSPVTAKITTITPKADLETRNVLIEATLRNPDHKLLSGMFGQVEVNIGNAKPCLTLPQSAISFNPYGELVYIIHKNGQDKDGQAILTVKQSFVTVGSLRGDQIAVLTGLKEGDMVVTSGQNKLRNGSRVQINNALAPKNEINPSVDNE